MMKKPNRVFFVYLCALTLLFSAGLSFAGDLVSGLDDSEALIDLTSAYSDNGGNIPPIDGAGEITLAAQFNADPTDLAPANGGSVVILEVGGTSFGQGLYLCGSDIVFATKGSSGGNGNNFTQSGLNDLDVSDNAAAVTIGAVSAGQDTIVYASFDSNTGQLQASLNGVISNFQIVGTSGFANLTGNESITFLGTGTYDPGHMGGLTNTDQGQDVLWDANSVNAFTGTSGTVVGAKYLPIWHQGSFRKILL